VLPSLLWHSAQVGLQSCQLQAPAALTTQGSSLVLISVRGWVDLRPTECGHLTNSKHRTGNGTRKLPLCGTAPQTTMSPLAANIEVRYDHRYARVPDPLCIHARILHLARAVRGRGPSSLYSIQCVTDLIITIYTDFWRESKLHVRIKLPTSQRTLYNQQFC